MRRVYVLTYLYCLYACLLVLDGANASGRQHPEPKQSAEAVTSRLTRTLLAAAGPKITALREKLNHVSAAEVDGKYMRGPQAHVKGVVSSRVEKTKDADTPYRGYVLVAVVWLSPDTSLFDTRQEAEDADLTETEAGRVRLTFAYQAGKWVYRGAKKE